MRRKIPAVTVGIVVLAAGGGGVAFASGSSSGGSRLDDGKELISQAKISEQQAIAAAQGAATGALDEVDLEHYDGRLVFNVDVGSSDVQVDAGSGVVLHVAQDDR